MTVVSVMSVVNDFPDPRTAEIEDDIIAIGGCLDAENLKKSYAMGIFPWPHEGYPLLWFCPDKRGILDFKDLHIPRSLEKWIKKNQSEIKITINKKFNDVMKECQKQKRKDQKGSWINKEMITAYSDLQKKGGALSLECWIGDELISGIYGVMSKKYFSCESMFFKKTNASKYAFIQLVEHLKKQNMNWMDLQMVTDVSESFGAKYISRKKFLDRIV